MSLFLNNRKKVSVKIFAFVITATLVIAPIALTPQKAEALFTTTLEVPYSPLTVSAGATAASTGLTATIENVLNGLAWTVAKMTIKGITRSIVAWINSGFQGNPAFVTNPQAFFADIVDQEIGKFIAGSDLQALCSPFQLEIKQALVLNRSSFQTKNQCRLSQVIGNFNDFINGTESQLGSAGGWAGWWNVSTHDNQFTQYANANAELQARILGRTATAKMELDWGKGFLSWKDCSQQSSGRELSNRAETSDDGSTITSDCPIVTPGSLIETTLGITVTSPLRQLELADSINEIVGALMTQLTTQVLSSTGLRGLSSSSGGSNNQSYLSNLYTEQRTDYGQVRGVTVQEIDKNIQIEQRFIGAKGGSISLLNQAQDIASSTIACYRAKLNPDAGLNLSPSEQVNGFIALANASSTITSVINPLRASINQQFLPTQQNISELQAIKSRMDDTSLNSVANFEAMLQQYLALRPSLHNESDIISAQSERDSYITSQIPVVELQAEYQKCLLFPQR